MPRCNPRSDPERFEKIQLEQQQIRQQYGSSVTMSRRCPYCLHMVEILYRGNHGMVQTRCQKCGEEVVFPPASFRRQKENGEIYLDQASVIEWTEILQNNRTCPKETRRYFIRDCIVDGEEIDSIFIEVSEEEYREWHRENETKRRIRTQDEDVVVLSLNAIVNGGEGDELSLFKSNVG